MTLTLNLAAIGYTYSFKTFLKSKFTDKPIPYVCIMSTVNHGYLQAQGTFGKSKSILMRIFCPLVVSTNNSG
jgi:hypothetical protein